MEVELERDTGTMDTIMDAGFSEKIVLNTPKGHLAAYRTGLIPVDGELQPLMIDQQGDHLAVVQEYGVDRPEEATELDVVEVSEESFNHVGFVTDVFTEE